MTFKTSAKNIHLLAILFQEETHSSKLTISSKAFTRSSTIGIQKHSSGDRKVPYLYLK